MIINVNIDIVEIDSPKATVQRREFSRNKFICFGFFLDKLITAIYVIKPSIFPPFQYLFENLTRLFLQVEKNLYL